ncbi:choice-of-anchor E domain-containing protein [Herbaspirillum seropedicae]|uniref:choice-of-anchor E domain-containing protein n=1 Tax=Herbaspirillum seropedicae TaxID=964 RepID=UPI0011209155|nr:choice-of-anchor E domain-containing protein [Herbaspirillum seropedicae]QDD67163.1 choice-of-anchor E domain-containing protein [Herbaspirillum seropedicae]
MKKFSSLLVSFAAAASFMAAAPAHATLTTVTSAWQQAAFDLPTIDASATVQFNGFNASLGKLIGVTVKFIMDETLTDTIYNFNTRAVTVGNPRPVFATSTITATGPLGLSTVNQLTTTPQFAGVVPAAPALGSFGSKSISNTVTGIQSGPVTVNGTPASLAAYIGGQNSVTINVDGEGSQSGSLPPNVMNGYSASANGMVYLQYIYQVPEPASMALFALGLLALTQLRRRKSS